MMDVDIKYDTKKNVLRMKQEVRVTYHRIDLFKDMYSEIFRSQLFAQHTTLKKQTFPVARSS